MKSSLVGAVSVCLLLGGTSSFYRGDKLALQPASATPERFIKVQARAGLFLNAVCTVGRVYVRCADDTWEKNTNDVAEVGIPGVRLVLLDGTSVITDAEGRYSVCFANAQTQVIKVDRSTLPKGAHLVPFGSRNAGVGDSLFIDSQNPFLHADFIETSCGVEIMDQVRARRDRSDIGSSRHKFFDF